MGLRGVSETKVHDGVSVRAEGWLRPTAGGRTRLDFRFWEENGVRRTALVLHLDFKVLEAEFVVARIVEQVFEKEVPLLCSKWKRWLIFTHDLHLAAEDLASAIAAPVSFNIFKWSDLERIT
jgi:hypothetical protein